MGLKIEENKRRVGLFNYHCPVLSMARESLLGLGLGFSMRAYVVGFLLVRICFGV
jgi:hypothetical protein